MKTLEVIMSREQNNPHVIMLLEESVNVSQTREEIIK